MRGPSKTILATEGTIFTARAATDLMQNHKDYKHNYSKEARKNYLTRSAGIKNKSGKSTKNDKFSANYWARKDLWKA